MEETTDETIAQIDDHLLLTLLQLHLLFEHKWLCLWISCLSNNDFCPQVSDRPNLDNMAKDAEICRTPDKHNFPFVLLHQWRKAQQLWVLFRYLV